MRIPELILRVVLYILYLLLWHIYGLLRYIFWCATGTAKEHKHSQNNYTKCAHVQNIIFRYKLDYMGDVSSTKCFITTHHNFVHPDYLRKQCVTLFNTTLTEAIFVETDPSVDATHSDNGVFLRSAQYVNAKKMIVVPIEYFHRLAEEVGPVKAKLVFLHNTMRCGSTLMCQIFEQTGHAVAFSEPDAPNAITEHRKVLSGEALERVVINTINMMCKPQNKQVSVYLFKFTGPIIDELPIFTRCFPNAIQLFMYRDGPKVASSLESMEETVCIIKIMNIVSVLHPYLMKKSMEALHLPSHDMSVKFKTAYSLMAYFWAIAIDKYKRNRKKGVNINAIRYEHLVENPLASIRAVLEHCGLPVEWAEDGIRALEKDSQRNSSLSCKNLASFKPTTLTEEIKMECDNICASCHLPPFKEPLILEGTIN